MLMEPSGSELSGDEEEADGETNMNPTNIKRVKRFGLICTIASQKRKSCLKMIVCLSVVITGCSLTGNRLGGPEEESKHTSVNLRHKYVTLPLICFFLFHLSQLTYYNLSDRFHSCVWRIQTS